jgi:hypothetical protein
MAKKKKTTQRPYQGTTITEQTPFRVTVPAPDPSNPYAGLKVVKPLPAIVPPPVAPEKKEKKPSETEIWRAEGEGIIGTTLRDGRTFLGLSPEDVAKMAAADQAKWALPEGTVPTGTQQQAIKQQGAVQEQQAIGAELAQQVGQPNEALLENIEATPYNWGSAAGAGAVGAIPGLVARGLAGAAVGTAIAPGIGTAIGGAAAIGGFLMAARSNLASQMTGEIAAKKITLTEGNANLKNLIADTNANPSHAAENLALFNYQLSRIERAYSELHLDTQRNLDKFLGKDGTAQLERYASFYSVGGDRDLYVLQMQMALINPDPKKVSVSIEDPIYGDISYE